MTISTGSETGAYYAYAKRYAELLERARGITLEIKTSSGSQENLQRVRSGEVDIAFVQGGVQESVKTNGQRPCAWAVCHTSRCGCSIAVIIVSTACIIWRTSALRLAKRAAVFAGWSCNCLKPTNFTRQQESDSGRRAERRRGRGFYSVARLMPRSLFRRPSQPLCRSCCVRPACGS